MSRRSLAGRLTTVLMLFTIAVAAVAGAWSYRQASTHARELQDDVLLQVASLAASAGPGRLTTDAETLSSATADIDVGTLSGSGLAPSTPPGLLTVTVAGTPRRVAVARAAAGPGVVASQPVAARDRIARDAALSAVLPLLVLLPLLVVAIAVAVRRVLAPVEELAAEVSARAVSDLRPLDEDRAPQELRGFVTALNGQVARAEQAVVHERRFISQAAHELRTPLTAMAVQLDRAGSAPADRRGDRLADLDAGLRRARHVVDQLLDLARAQADQDADPATERFDVLLGAVVSDVLPAADAAGVEIVLESGADEPSRVHLAATSSALRNLLDNAVRYGADGGLVVLAARRDEGSLVVTVDDGGPGMADPDALSRPFVRGSEMAAEGSGLGLVIVAEQVARFGGSVSFGATARFPTGTRAMLQIPVA